jgi:hypothetical protein
MHRTSTRTKSFAVTLASAVAIVLAVVGAELGAFSAVGGAAAATGHSIRSVATLPAPGQVLDLTGWSLLRTGAGDAFATTPDGSGVVFRQTRLTHRATSMTVTQSATPGASTVVSAAVVAGAQDVIRVVAGHGRLVLAGAGRSQTLVSHYKPGTPYTIGFTATGGSVVVSFAGSPVASFPVAAQRFAVGASGGSGESIVYGLSVR